MACLVPQFKCAPDTHFASRAPPCHHHAHSHLKTRMFVCVRAQCVSTATIADVEKLHIPSFESHATSVAAIRPLTYSGAIGPPLQKNFDTKATAETLFAHEEAVIAAAAAEAIALAQAAVEVAKDAAQMIGSTPSLRSRNLEESNHEYDALRLEMSRLSEMESRETIEQTTTIEVGSDDEQIAEYPSLDADDAVENEFELSHILNHSEVAVRSGRLTERKARRARAAERLAASGTTVKSGTKKKKRIAVQTGDYSDPLRYIRRIAYSTRLLTASEEVELSAGIQELIKLEKLQEELANRYGNQPTLAQWAAAAGTDTRNLRKSLDYGYQCKDRMVRSNIRLVISIAKNYVGSGMNLPDLVQEGCKGLARGAEKFDASKGFKFSTYAHWWIKQSVRKALADQSRTIRLPFHMVEATYRVKEARKKFHSETGRYPNNEEIAKATGLTVKRIEAVFLVPKPPRSLDQKIGNLNMKHSEVIADPESENWEVSLMKDVMKSELKKALDSLKPRERQVVKLRYGIPDGRMKTLQEIGDLMGVSRERIRQIESSAFRKLRSKKRANNLRQYLKLRYY